MKQFFDDEYDDIRKLIQPVETLRKEFTRRFPIDQISNMQLDDYIVGKGKESFCYWLETKLKPLGSIKGSPAGGKFGVYFSKEVNDYKTISKWDEKLNPDIAFKKIKNEINKLLLAGKNKNLKGIIKNEISPMFKYKILASYYPGDYLNIFSESHVDYFLSKLNIEYDRNIHVEEKRKRLTEYKESKEQLRNVDNYIFSAFLYWWSKPKVREVRLLPMSKDEFPNWSIEKIQNQFFLEELTNKKGYFNYVEKGISALKGALVLFQYDNHIIGSAKLLEVKKHKVPINNIYKGAYLFDKDSIRTFEPLSSDDIKEIDPSFKKFSQVKQSLDPSCYEKFMALIQLRSGQSITEEIPEKESKKYTEGSKSQVIVNAYERNSKARQDCIRVHGYQCMICNFDFAKVYGDQFEGKIHVHHRKPLSEVDDKYQVNPEKDLIPVCPNCHMILHSKPNGTYTSDEVKAFIKKEKENETA